MNIIKAGDHRFEVEVVVFDKDGLLFDSQHFWKYLAAVRTAQLEKIIGAEHLKDFYHLFGIEFSGGEISHVDPNGIFAVASIQEEVIVAASIIHRVTTKSWTESRDIAKQIFTNSDKSLDLSLALKPKRGFPDIFKKLDSLSIPYGVATSDDYNRTKESLELFGCWEGASFVITPDDVKNGKPHPDMIQLVSKKMEADTSKIMMVGDSYVDVQMAKNAGAIAVGIPDDLVMGEKMKPHATVLISSLDEIEVVQGGV